MLHVSACARCGLPATQRSRRKTEQKVGCEGRGGAWRVLEVGGCRRQLFRGVQQDDKLHSSLVLIFEILGDRLCLACESD